MAKTASSKHAFARQYNADLSASSRSRALTAALFLIAISFFAVSTLPGQAQSSSADLAGVVRDQSGAVLPGVDLTVTRVDTGLSRTASTNHSGRYKFPLLPPGDYEFKAELPGFATQILSGIRITVGQSATLDILMGIAETTEEVMVRSAAAIIERERTVQASTLTQVEISNLPINGRQFLDFALLTPGVTDRNSLVTESAVQAPDSGLSFGGQDGRSNHVMIDGVDNMDPISNAVRSTLSQEAVQEFQINRNTFSAEFGRARGGLINIVSKSGTNSFHGSGFFFWRDDRFDATNTFATSSPRDPTFERYQFGATLGGPLVRDRTFFFTAYERLDREESLFVTFLDDDAIFAPTPSQFELFSFLGSTGVPSLEFLAAAFIDPDFGALWTLPTNAQSTLDLFERESGVFPFQADSDTFSFKLDHQATSSNQMNFRFSSTDSFTDNASFGALEGVSNGVKFDVRDLALVFADTHVFSPSTLNEFRFQYSRRDLKVPTNDPVGPQITIAGVAEFGREFFNPSAYELNNLQFANNITLIRGSHTLKIGADFNLMDMTGFAEVFLGGRFSFGERVPLASILNSTLGPGVAEGLIAQLQTPTEAGGLGRPDLTGNVLASISAVQSFNYGLPVTFLQGFGDPHTEILLPRLGVYGQDTWRIRQNFTLNLGLRYDLDWPTDTTNVVNAAPPFRFETAPLRDRNNIVPRIGFAWDPFNAGSTAVRGGYGVFHQSDFQAIAFISRVLSGFISAEPHGIAQVFLPLTGLPGITDVTSADVWQEVLGGATGQEALEKLGLTPGTTPSVILPGSSNAVTPYSQHASLGIEQALGRDWAVEFDYNLNRGVHLIRSRDINVNEIADNVFEGVLDPRFVQINMIETSASSVYHGFASSLRKRFSNSNGFNLSLTLGKAIDDTTDFITPLQPNNQRNLRGERSLSTFDQRVRFVASGVFLSPYNTSKSNTFSRNLVADWIFSPIVTASSGKPFNLLNGFDRNQDTHEETDRPLQTDGSQIGRNTGMGPGFFSVDMRLARRIALPGEGAFLEFIFEAFNLLNHVNYSGVNNVVGNQRLPEARVQGSSDRAANRPLGFTSAFAPRQIQFGIRVSF